MEARAALEEAHREMDRLRRDFQVTQHCCLTVYSGLSQWLVHITFSKTMHSCTLSRAAHELTFLLATALPAPGPDPCAAA